MRVKRQRILYLGCMGENSGRASAGSTTFMATAIWCVLALRIGLPEIRRHSKSSLRARHTATRKHVRGIYPLPDFERLRIASCPAHQSLSLRPAELQISDKVSA